MANDGYNLAIETSGRVGSISLGRGDVLLATEPLPQKQRHNIDLVPVMAAVFDRYGLKPSQLEQVYISTGPGSFTGLRIAVATVKMLALAGDVKIVDVPTLDVVASNAPAEHEHVAVGLNLKRDTLWSGIYHRRGDGILELVGEAKLMTMAQLLSQSPRPVAVLGDPLPPLSDLPAGMMNGVTVLPASLSKPASESLWHLGRIRSMQGRYIEAGQLLPLYARSPEAVLLWNERKRKSSTQSVVK